MRRYTPCDAADLIETFPIGSTIFVAGKEIDFEDFLVCQNLAIHVEVFEWFNDPTLGTCVRDPTGLMYTAASILAGYAGGIARNNRGRVGEKIVRSGEVDPRCY